MTGIIVNKISHNEIVDLTNLLSGAFAEGADLGSRETHIRKMGDELSASLKNLKYALSKVELDVDSADMTAYLKQIADLAKIASNYGKISAENPGDMPTG